jgi:hypothetical protein
MLSRKRSVQVGKSEKAGGGGNGVGKRDGETPGHGGVNKIRVFLTRQKK